MQFAYLQRIYILIVSPLFCFYTTLLLSCKYLQNKLVAHLNRYNCPAEDVRYIKSAIPRRKNIAFTYTAENSNTSIIGISEVSNCDELTNSIVHELNHAKIAILNKFNIDLESEAAAYLIGELAKEAHKLIKVCILTRP